MRRIGILCWCLYAGVLSAQSEGAAFPAKKHLLRFDAPPWNLPDSLISPGSIQLRGEADGHDIPPSCYSIVGNAIWWTADSAAIPFPLRITYQCLPPWLTQPFYLRAPPTYPNSGDSSVPFTYRPYTETSPGIQFRKLDYSGRFTRGFSIGNTQDLGLNAAFNLQLNGDLGDGIRIQAAISDENLPLQPEGNSLQLRDFDRVYIHLQRNKQSLTAGDYDLLHQTGHFMRYASRLQGVLVKNEAPRSTQQAAAAIARGKFTRYVLSVQEGNQGPYPLSGASGEAVAVVIAGTERVWHNGQLLQRGADYDYLIDYNRGELTFTWRRRILRESRITIEYEYADQNFLRSIYTMDLSRSFRKASLYAHYYSRQDSRTPTSNLSLTDTDRQIIQRAGDDPEKAYISTIRDAETYLPSRVYYSWKDTLTNCGHLDSILLLSSPPDAPQRVTARFSFVGKGKGHYRRYEQPLANERAYYWVAPDPETCQPTGDYEPILQITPPQQHQLLVVGQTWNPSRIQLQTEVALSHLDKNRLSALDQTDDIGAAAFLFLHYRPLPPPDSNRWQWTSDLSVETRQAHFQEINPYRNPEFLRTWSLTSFNGQGNVPPAAELLSSLSASLEHPRKGKATFQSQTYQRATSYRGIKQSLEWQLIPDNWKIQGNVHVLNARSEQNKLLFIQPTLDLAKQFPRWQQHTVFLSADGEQNARYAPGSRAVLPASFSYGRWRIGVESPGEKKTYYQAAYSQRSDQSPYAGEWKQATIARELSASGRWSPTPSNHIQGDLSYRQLATNTTLFPEQTPSRNSLLGRLDAAFFALHGLLRSQTLYELGSGQEARQEFTFIKVAPGEGVYIWLDSLYNQDGVIQPAEMQLAPFPDQADFIRVATISTRYVQTDYLQLSQNLQLEPRALWKSPPTKHPAKLLSKLSAQSSWKKQQKTIANAGTPPLFPQMLPPDDSSLVGLNEQSRHAILFNRGNPHWELQLARQHTQSKQLQVAGFELRGNRETLLLLRWNPAPGWSVRTQAAQGNKQSQISWMNSRNYLLQYQKIETQLSWVPASKWRTQINTRFQTDQDRISGGIPHARTLELKSGTTLTPRANTALNAQLSYVSIDFEGETRSPAGYAILNGLRPGSNWLWSLGIERQINRNLQLRVQYDGRKTGQSPVIHRGSLQISAVF